MKNRLKLAALALVSSFILQPSSVPAQGSLAPPGPPAPTMKSLDQIEPRTAISSAPYIINAPGSYYLTTNISVSGGNAITIGTNSVTLDLNGFTISSTEASPAGTGILLGNGVTDIIIRNGHITGQVTYSGGVYGGSGFANGIEESSVPPLNVRVTGVAVSGCLDDGIAVSPNSTVVESCTVRTVGGYGIDADSVVHSTAEQCGLEAISADAVADSIGNSTGGSDGVDASFSANNCTGFSSSGTGIYTTTANNCYGATLTGTGISAGTASGCQGLSFSGSGDGIDATTALNCVGTAAGNGNGLHASDTAQNCSGTSTGTGSGYGLIASVADNCYGEADGSGFGLHAPMAVNCRGVAKGSGYGIDATCANNCWGQGTSSYGINTLIAIGCFGDNIGGNTNMLQTFIGNSSYGNGGSETVIYKYNMP